MKKLMLSVFAFAAVVLSASADTGNGTASMGGSSAATLQAPITLSEATLAADNAGTTIRNGSELNFATINVVTDGGTVVVSPTNAWTSDNMTSPDKLTAASAAGFEISALEGTHYSVSYTDGGDLSNNGTTLTLTNFQTSATGIVGTDLASNTFLVGATLNIPASPKLGAYVGTFTVKVDYE